MPLDDRDRSFEKALAIRLRTGRPAADCPDAETLAAYHERALTPDELTSWKSHIASCGNCQQILAHLETLDEIPRGAFSEQNASSEASGLVRPGALAAPAVAAEKAAAVSMAPVPKRQLITHWRWIVPVGAIAAGLLVWVAVHENQPTAILSPAKIEVAQNRSSADERKVGTQAPAEREKPDQVASLSKVVPPTGDRVSDSSAAQYQRDIPTSKAVASAPPEGRPEGANPESESARLAANSQVSQNARTGIAAGAAVGGIAAAQKEKKSDEPARQDQALNYVAAAAPAAPKPQSAGEAGVLSQLKDEKQLQAGQTSSGPRPAETADKKGPEGADTLTAKQQALVEAETVTSGAAAAPAMRMAKTRAPRSVPAPGGKVIWRLGFGGLIEQSLDGGQTWTAQSSGTTETLFLGSAPSEKVCWVISATGTILRTTDSGATWLPVASPIQQNLALIRATDALHATVWDISHRYIFETSDGGATWTSVSAH